LTGAEWTYPRGHALLAAVAKKEEDCWPSRWGKGSPDKTPPLRIKLAALL